MVLDTIFPRPGFDYQPHQPSFVQSSPLRLGISTKTAPDFLWTQRDNSLSLLLTVAQPQTLLVSPRLSSRFCNHAKDSNCGERRKHGIEESDEEAQGWQEEDR